MPEKRTKKPDYCPVHESFMEQHNRLCLKVDWLIKLMLANLGSVILTLVTVIGGLLYYIAKVGT